jgi:hypothetical protein
VVLDDVALVNEEDELAGVNELVDEASAEEDEEEVVVLVLGELDVMLDELDVVLVLDVVLDVVLGKDDDEA